jgi:hypothetical protein
LRNYDPQPKLRQRHLPLEYIVKDVRKPRRLMPHDLWIEHARPDGHRVLGENRALSASMPAGSRDAAGGHRISPWTGQIGSSA